MKHSMFYNIFALGVGCAVGINVAASEPAVGEDTAPVTKVVNLLQSLKERIKTDSKEEGKSFDKYACWCQATSKRKAEDITDAQEDMRRLSQQTLSLRGKVAVLASEIATLTKKIEENDEQQKDATAIRQKENAAFVADATEMKEALAALEKAITVLKKATRQTSPAEGSLLQQETTMAVSAVRAALRALPSRAHFELSDVSLLSEFAVSGAGAGAMYAPQSATVQGILANMYSTFAADLESAHETEGSRNRLFEDLIATLESARLDFEATRERKEDAKASAEEALADALTTYDDTERQMKADTAFFDETKAACEGKRNDWDAREKLRNEELAGIQRAIDILAGDEARDLFRRAIKPGFETFLQVASVAESSVKSSAPAGRAYAKLSGEALRSHSLRLAALALELRTTKVGHFDKVLAAIDSMIATLNSEGSADIAKRDQCKEEYKIIASVVADLNWKIEVNTATIGKLNKLIAQKTEEKVQTVKEIEEVNATMIAMTEQREAENTAFLHAKKEDLAAIKLLSNATDALVAFYNNNSVQLGKIQASVKDLALAQKMPLVEPEFAVSEDQAPDGGFSAKGSRKIEAKNILSLMMMITQELEDEVENDTKEEAAMQAEYDRQMDAARKSRAALQKKKVHLVKEIADRESDRNDEENLKGENEDDLKGEQDYQKDIKPDCDWIIRAFAERAERRAAEMGGLVQAKEYLAGANPPKGTA